MNAFAEDLSAQLDQLSLKEIQARLPSWNKDQLILVQRYLEERRRREPSEPTSSAQLTMDAAWVAAEAANVANAKATLALALAVVALLASLLISPMLLLLWSH